MHDSLKTLALRALVFILFFIALLAIAVGLIERLT